MAETGIANDVPIAIADYRKTTGFAVVVRVNPCPYCGGQHWFFRHARDSPQAWGQQMPQCEAGQTRRKFLLVERGTPTQTIPQLSLR